ncbi:metallophosphoesterase family protein [Bacillus sp. 2205SS5-2]|uniref:metallophosphoesterase family protein n=1 Tax=Bacillus sp. 2205SS5-2 TaxID=3109031 RepID=UPI003007BA03
MPTIQFIHTADLHLDSPFTGLKSLPKEIFNKLCNSTFLSFERIVKEAIQREVDFLLISGDLYDGEDRSIKAQARLQKQFRLLQEASIPVFIIHGNHDHLSGNWHELSMPGNVHIFGEHVEELKLETKQHQQVHLYGFSYRERHIYDRKIKEYPLIKNSADFHIALLHGSEGSLLGSTHQPYAPFTLSELVNTGMDYWALGHIHKAQKLSSTPLILYPGNIQGRHRNEIGEKGCYHVILSKDETNLQFVPTQEVVWVQKNVNLEEEISFSEFYSMLQRVKEGYRELYTGTLLEIKINGNCSSMIASSIHNGELLQSLQDGEDVEERFVWIHSLSIETVSKSVQNSPILLELHETMEGWSDKDWEEAVADLYTHPQASRYLNDDNFNSKSKLKEKTAILLESTMKAKDE